ncbi:MAG: GGDEF domain-containing protein [Gammaproteobacteria bacterium]|nr:GGDEF domain-containing protein [Gammaproteobacteria bacterium]MCP4090981.1 GGDEF domain-containing protein [Gammaproteobacteria bacterium]MCP4277493.1 GGDEF domain-containing protein [Gammaproteobacteria bacterium]MCP4831446.1 GGDEF domain-containing protein [Gammaproteobacteria bacterium]MCP4928526.1 GGDEF domain-containing protein [Gammaproteobacteria bacterium]
MNSTQLAVNPASFSFQHPLESKFRKVYLTESISLIRGALLTGFLFLLTFLALDYWIAEPDLNKWSTSISAGILQFLALAMLCATFHPTAKKLLPQLGITLGLTIAATFLLLNVFVTTETLNTTFSSYVAVTFYIYFFLGLRFWSALVAAAALFISFVVATYLQGEITDVIIYGTYLLFINLVCTIFLYNHETNCRKQFLESLTLNDLVRRDPLTGLANRKGLAEHLQDMWANAKREKKPLALALIDIDHFKDYNDHYGHQAGDRCLINVAEVVGKAARRPLDFAARFGGEEFMLLLPGLNLEEAEKIIGQLRREIEHLNILHQTSPTANQLTISAGLTHLYPHETSRSIQGFIQLADETLYEAKQRGRNRVSVSGIHQNESLQTGLFKNNEITGRA